MTRDGPPGPADDDASPAGPAQAGGNQPAPGGARGALPPADGGRPTPGGAGRPSDVDLPPIEGPPGVEVPALPANPQDQPPTLEPLPGPSRGSRRRATQNRGQESPGSGRRAADRTRSSRVASGVTFINPRSGRDLDIQQIGTTPEGYEIYIVRNGVNIVTQCAREVRDSSTSRPTRPSSGAGPTPRGQQGQRGPNGEYIDEQSTTPMEVYLEGNVIVRQDQRKWAGKGDQRTLRAPQVYYNFLTDRFVAHDAEIDFFAPGLLAPMRIKSPRIEQYHDADQAARRDLQARSEQPKIRADQAVTTGSRFPNPGYKIYQKSIDLTRYARPSTDPISGKHLTNPGDPESARGPGLADRRPAELLLHGAVPGLLLAAGRRRPRRPAAAAPPVLLPDQ